VKFGFGDGEAITINESGYIYIWLSNESKDARVWFDDLTVTHTQSLVVQATDYGVWGDVIREQKTDETLYRYAYQGQYAEKDDETGWNHFELREYDPIIGRWLGPDPEGQHWSPYLALGNDPINKFDLNGGWDGYQSPQNGWQRFWNWASGHGYSNHAYDFLTNTPDRYIINSIAYLDDRVVFNVDILSSNKEDVWYANSTYTFIGDGLYIDTFDFFFDLRGDLGIPEDGGDPGVKYAGVLPKLEGWIAKKTFRQLGKSDLRGKFVEALEKGWASAFGSEGIKPLAGKGLQGSDGVWYKFELKVRGQVGKNRLLGNMEKWPYKKGKETITKDIVIFRNWLVK
jgi:RHS repeat-associated protein